MTMVAGPFVEVAQGTAGRNDVPVFYYVLPGREADGERAFAKTPAMIDGFEERTRHAVSVRALLADRRLRFHLRRHGEHVGDHADGPDAARRDRAPRLLERSARRARAGASVVRRPADLPRLVARVAQRRLRHVLRGRLARDRPRRRRVRSTTSSSASPPICEEDAERYRRPIVCNMYSDPIDIFDRHLYQKGGGGAAHAARRAGRRALLARDRAATSHDNARRIVETIDLIRAIEEATGRNVRGFFDQWVFRGRPSRA